MTEQCIKTSRLEYVTPLALKTATNRKRATQKLSGPKTSGGGSDFNPSGCGGAAFRPVECSGSAHASLPCHFCGATDTDGPRGTGHSDLASGGGGRWVERDGVQKAVIRLKFTVAVLYSKSQPLWIVYNSG